MADPLPPLTRSTYCVADVWNGNLTWNSEDPDFTPCFHKTILGEFGKKHIKIPKTHELIMYIIRNDTF